VSMRICHVMLAKGFGGAERYFVDLSQELARRGHHVLAICHPSGMARERLGRMAGLEIATVRSLGNWDPFTAGRLRALIEAFRPAVVQAHLARAAFHTGTALRDTQVPLLSMTHNYVNIKYYARVNKFLPATRDQAAYLRQCGITAERMQVVPNFSVLPAMTPPPDRPAALIALGRMVQKKGFHILLAALADLRRRDVPLPPVLIGGDGPLRKKLEQASLREGLGGVVRFAGWLTDPVAFLDQGTLFVLPSLDEPFGIVVLEAMARGLPIVATSTQGPREILDAASAILVPPGDSAALAEALMLVLAHPATARTRAACATDYFVSRYSADAVVPQLLAVYEGMPRNP